MEIFELIIIQCEECGQRMRIKPSAHETLLRCPTCKHESLRAGADSLGVNEPPNANSDISPNDISRSKKESAPIAKFVIATVVVILIVVAVKESNDRKRIAEQNRRNEEMSLSVLGGVISEAGENAGDSGAGVRNQMGIPKHQPKQPSWEEQQRGGIRHYDADGNYIGRSK
jgi:ssDNA-binding Zn-finger/Zn-ribbon topoisomerase 1